jgi:hypothetical protein
MINNICTDLIVHDDADETILKSIVCLKSQHWHYSIEEQLSWIKKNINPDDYHILIRSGNTLIAYMNMVHRKVLVGAETHLMLGIGNVCIHLEYQKLQLGILAMNICQFFLGSLSKKGILLTKNHLLAFYEKAGWFQFQGKTFCRGQLLDNFTFLSDETQLEAGEISFEKNF